MPIFRETIEKRQAEEIESIRNSSRGFTPHLCKGAGFTLIEIAIVLVIIGILLSIGTGMIGILTKRAKLSEAREIVKDAREAVIGYAVKNGYLPANLEAAGTRKLDAWGNDLAYYPTSEFDASPEHTCGVNATGMEVYECLTTACETGTEGTDYRRKTNIAFVVYSKGFDNNGAGTGTVSPFKVRPQDVTYTDGATTYNYDDIVAYVSLDKIRSGMGCTAGSSTAIPITPTGLTATVIGTSAIRLDWNAVGTNTDGSAIINLTGYNIYRVAGAGTPTLYKFLQNSNTTGTVSYVDTNAGYFNTYTYNVKAVNAFGTESAATANVSDPGVYGNSSIFQTSAATNWFTTESATICFQFQVQNHTAANINVTNNRMTWTGAAPTRYKIAASIGAYPACPVTGTTGCTPSGTNVTAAYNLTANGANTGFVSVTFFNSTTCDTYGSVATSNNPRIGFNTNAYSIGDATNGLQ